MCVNGNVASQTVCPEKNGTSNFQMKVCTECPSNRPQFYDRQCNKPLPLYVRHVVEL